MYSHHPFNAAANDIIISAVWGLGPYAVDGVITPDTYRVGKAPDLPILEMEVSVKPVQLVAKPDEGLQEIPVPAELQDRPCLNPEQIKTLAGYGIRLEEHYRGPQDVEWALDRDGRLLVLQSRPLRLPAPSEGDLEAVPAVAGYPVLLAGGAVAFPGVGCGPAFQVLSDEDLLSFPEGAVLVARHSSPKFVMVMPKAQAIVTDAGSISGHMASLAREFAVPTLLNAKVATTAIPPGVEVTVDAYAGRVYQGRVPELLARQQSPGIPYARYPGVSNPEKSGRGHPAPHPGGSQGSGIHPEALPVPPRPGAPGARTVLHRDVSDQRPGGGKRRRRREVGGPHSPGPLPHRPGWRPHPRRPATRVTVDQIASVPLRALLKGMLHQDLRAREPRPIELSGLLSVMREQLMASPNIEERFGEKSYAIISDKYLNFSSRVGYHYSVLDAYVGQTVNKNYLTFSFKGGAADDLRRNRRVRAIALVLLGLDFSVEVKGDRVDARLQKYEAQVLEEKLDHLGRLLQFTRQLDMLMTSEASVELVARNFLAGNYGLDLGRLASGNSPLKKMKNHLDQTLYQDRHQ